MADYYRPPKLLGTLEINRIPNDRPMASSQQMTDGAKNCSVAGALNNPNLVCPSNGRIEKTITQDVTFFFLPPHTTKNWWLMKTALYAHAVRQKETTHSTAQASTQTLLVAVMYK